MGVLGNRRWNVALESLLQMGWKRSAAEAAGKAGQPAGCERRPADSRAGHAPSGRPLRMHHPWPRRSIRLPWVVAVPLIATLSLGLWALIWQGVLLLLG